MSRILLIGALAAGLAGLGLATQSDAWAQADTAGTSQETGKTGDAKKEATDAAKDKKAAKITVWVLDASGKG